MLDFELSSSFSPAWRANATSAGTTRASPSRPIHCTAWRRERHTYRPGDTLHAAPMAVRLEIVCEHGIAVRHDVAPVAAHAGARGILQANDPIGRARHTRRDRALSLGSRAERGTRERECE